MKKFLSLIIPAYNVEKYIIDTIMSIINNKGIYLEDIEIIVINDGSSDNTKCTIEEFKKDKDIPLILINQDNKGVGFARNEGISVAKGEFIWFIDGDDCIAINSIQYILKLIDKIQYDVIRIGDCNCFNPSSKITNIIIEDIKEEDYFIIDSYKLISSKYRHGHTTYIWRRNFLLNHNLFFPTELVRHQDWVFLLNALLKAENVYVNFSYKFYLYRTNVHWLHRSYSSFLKYDSFISCKFQALDRFIELRDKNALDPKKSEAINQFIVHYNYGFITSCITQKFPNVLIFYTIKKMQSLGYFPLKNYTNKNKLRYFIYNKLIILLIANQMYRGYVRVVKLIK